MAAYVKFRLNAAKVSVSMALLAAIAGLAEKAQASSAQPQAKTAFLGFLKLGGLSSAISTPLLKIEKKLIKMNTELTTLQMKDKQFLKIRSANNTFLKIKSAESDFASLNFLNASFLKIDDAALKYLKIDGTAANSAELGGLAPDAFVQGRGGVATAGILIGLNQPAASLLKTPDGKLSVSVSSDGQQLSLNFTNNTGGALDGLATDAAAVGPQRVSIGMGEGKAALQSTTDQYHLQLFPNASNEAMTLIISVRPTPADDTKLEVVAQMLIGLL